MIGAIPSLPVSNLKSSVQFYTNRLGFQLIQSNQTSVSLQNGEVDLFLIEKKEIPIMYCGFYVNNLKDHLPEVVSIKELSDIGKLSINKQGGLYFKMRDPDGNIIEIIEQIS
ncbi:hypothetical protein JCM19046_675 [Bacillus sp. JCM 19046]|uniref:Catechol 2,3-dioxygenase-like lactoylglutathione lyase family enzyme n=1 Tax=Shouchella xiaoxiensis TaxID=766895 RepID=A0ABS2STE8_9BACI|nr:VOC family protein [Shouchella xiaoxiensis]MBM7838804.1 catechol 2,3-dioxygenase-like lactoylglutathione lyase family enzyme [Shouchella xiaoxiensis]GAF11966.1 hypothetical protein JCM19045_1109 [Bacillus sp. JCM 19045]GAF16259.1 hypothetical protein JCM19046_675 [Bacillus sp. JCM 19046]